MTGAGSDDRVHQELRQALRSGPFPAALHLAIEVSGYTLDDIQVWLAERGARVSVPTLSYWRRGRSRPERASSLRAVRLLEELLGLPPDALVSLLGPRRPRGRWIGHAPGSLDMGMLWSDERPRDLLAVVGVSPGDLSRVSSRTTVRVGADRRVRSIRVSDTLRANHDRVHRHGVVYISQEEHHALPVIGEVEGARLGRVKVDREAGLIATEIVLDRVLDAGELTAVDYEWRFNPGVLLVNYELRLVEPMREFVLRTRFAPGVVPAGCHRYDRRTGAAPEGNDVELWIGASGTAVLAEQDVPAGIIGVRWDWPDAPEQQECHQWHHDEPDQGQP